MNDIDPTGSLTKEEKIARFGFNPSVAEKILNAKRCFVLATGPSLAKVEPEGLRDELVIGVNHILRTKFRPDIICVSDARRLDTQNLKHEGAPKLITARYVYTKHQSLLEDVDHYHDIEFVSLARSVLDIDEFDPEFKKVYWTASVVGDLVIPLACYLGIPEIYVLGMDGARASFPVSHVWGADQKVIGPHDSKLFHLHEKAAILAQRAGSRVYNASLGGVVEAFQKVALEKVKPEAVARKYEGAIEKRYLVFGGRVFQAIPSSVEEGAFRFYHKQSTRYIRHRSGKVFSDKDDGSEQFASDSSFVVEPSFVRRDWVALRAVNTSSLYVATWDENSEYRLRSTQEVFSPYFSSFRLFDNEDQARSRIDTDRMLGALSQLKSALGNMMIRNDQI